MLPSDFEPIGVVYALNSRRADESGQCSGGVRPAEEPAQAPGGFPPAGKPEDKNSVPRHKVRNYAFIDLLNDLLEAQTNCASQQLVEQIALDSNAIVIVDMLGNTICRGGLDKGLPRGFACAV